MTLQTPYNERFIWGHKMVPHRNRALVLALEGLGAHGGRILEVGSGVGRFIRTIAHHRPDLEPHGSDLGPRSIRLAATYQDGVRYTVASATDLPYADESFENLILFDVLEHIPGNGPEAAIREAYRVLKPGGVFHALVPCEGQPGTLFYWTWKHNFFGDLKERHGDHVQRFERDAVLADLQRAGFEIESVKYSMHHIGQIKDILTYAERESWFTSLHLNNVVFKLLMRILWVCGYIESRILEHYAHTAAVIHVTATRRP